MEKVVDLTPVERPKKSTPWTSVSAKTKLTLIVASLIPGIIFLYLLIAADMDFMAGLILVFLPLQLVSSSLAGILILGRRGILDGMMITTTLFLGSFVFVLLMSVMWAVIERGFATLSPQFIYQNDVYVTPTTGLEIGGVGHAILGTLLVVGLSTIVTVPLALATAVYLTETRGKSRGLIRTLLQAMSGLPSVVSGLFIYSMLIISGITAYAGWVGSLALIPLMLPTVSRVAEEVVFHDPTTGASNDFEKATSIARQMVTQYGFSTSVGAVSYANGAEVFVGRDMGHVREFSEATAQVIDIEIRSILDAAHDEAYQAINLNRKVLDALAKALMEEETLNQEQIAKIFKNLKKLPQRQLWLSKASRPVSTVGPIAIPTKGSTSSKEKAAAAKAKAGAKPAAKPRTPRASAASKVAKPAAKATKPAAKLTKPRAPRPPKA